MRKAKTFVKGAHGVEPWTSRSAVECSTTELYPLGVTTARLFEPNPSLFSPFLYKKLHHLVKTFKQI